MWKLNGSVFRKIPEYPTSWKSFKEALKIFSCVRTDIAKWPANAPKMGTEICPTEQDVTTRKRNYQTTNKPGIEERLFRQPQNCLRVDTPISDQKSVFLTYGTRNICNILKNAYRQGHKAHPATGWRWIRAKVCQVCCLYKINQLQLSYTLRKMCAIRQSYTSLFHSVKSVTTPNTIMLTLLHTAVKWNRNFVALIQQED
jgi:hypothetical protein